MIEKKRSLNESTEQDKTWVLYFYANSLGLKVKT